MTIEWGQPGRFGADLGKLAQGMRLMLPGELPGQLRLDEVPPVRAGKLDKVLLLGTDRGAVDLGVLDLTLEMSSTRRLVTPAFAAISMDWVFTPQVAVVHIHGDVEHEGKHLGLAYRVSLTAANPTPGLLDKTCLALPHPVLTLTRKAREVHRRTTLGFAMRITERARPIGTVPVRRNGAFQAEVQ
jgi:hypothetical protein